MALSIQSPSLDELAMMSRLLCQLPGYLRHPLTVVEAESIVQRRLANRQLDFLWLMRQAVYDGTTNPYRRLLHQAGCEYGDLERLVWREGLEGALEQLYRRGVYLTVDEFKGREPVVRGSMTFTLATAELRNPMAAFHVLNRSSGSRGVSTAVRLDLSHIRDGAVDTVIAIQARGGLGWQHAVWGDPGSIAILQLLYAAFRRAPLHWFSQVDLDDGELHPRYRWSAHAIRAVSLLAGTPVGHPTYVPLADPSPIARWMAQVRQAGRTPHLMTYSSTAVRVCLAALQAGLDIRGAQFSIGGEPITDARQAVVAEAGAVAAPHYGTTETGGVASECLAPIASDDMHLCQDRVAVIQPGATGMSGGLPSTALLATSLRPMAPFVLLNVSMGDQACLERRNCGCPRHRRGWDLHMHTIRSFEKLTAGGMTFLDRDVVRVLEDVLPEQFGGAPTDYQLLEEQRPDGTPSLRLLVHPRLGPLEPLAVGETFLRALGGQSDRDRLMELQWRQAGLLRVERRPPLITGAGKILHLHVARPAHGIL
jgi:hypothetical protein